MSAVISPSPTIEPTVASTEPDQDFKPLDSDEARRKRYRQRLVARQKELDVKVSDFLLNLRRELRQLDQIPREKHAQDTDMMCRYVNGEQYGGYEGGVYQPATLKDGDYAYTIPVIKGHVEQSFMQLLKTQIEYEGSAPNENDPGAKDLAFMCEKLAVEEKNRLMTEDAQMDEIWNSIFAKQSYRCVIWGVNPDSPKTVKRINYKEETGQTAARRECQVCFQDVPAGVASCQNMAGEILCESTNIKEIPGGSFKRSIPSEEEVQLGENLLHIPHPTSVQRDYSAQKLRYASFIIERDELPLKEAEWKYQCDIQPDSEAVPPELLIRREQERAAMHTDPIVGSSRQPGTVGPANTQNVVREYVYVSVARYGDFYVSKDTIVPDGTPEGRKIPGDTLLGDTYPDGLFLLFAGNTILRVKGLNLNRRWTEVLYGRQAGSNQGAGMHSLMPLNDVVNDSFNLEYSLGMSSHPFTAVARKHVKQLPEANHLLLVDNVPQGGMDSIIKRFSGHSSTGFLAATADRVDSVMQFIEGTYSLQGNPGSPNQKALGTATGVAQVAENASGRTIGPINQRIFADKEMMYQLLQNIQEHCTKEKSPEQYKALEKRFGPDVCALFFACKSFRHAVTFKVAGNTASPRSMALTNANAMAFAQIAASFAKFDMPWVQELLATIADSLGVPFNIGPGRTDRREAEYRMNKLAAIEDRIALKNPNYLANTEQAAMLMFKALAQFCYPLIQTVEEDPVGCFIQDHGAFMDVYKDALFSEQAKMWSQARKNVVIQLWMLHYDAQMAHDFAVATKQKALQETLVPQPTPPTPEEVAAQTDAEDERAVAAEMLTRQADEEAKNADLQRKLDEKEHAAELDLATEQTRQMLMPPDSTQEGTSSQA